MRVWVGRTEMPLKRLKYTIDFIKPNIPSFILLIILVAFLGFLNEFNVGFSEINRIIGFALILILGTIINGYGLCVTKEISNNRNSLPKLEFYKSFVLGLKAFVVTMIYSTIQIGILWVVSVTFKFPMITINKGELMVENFGSLFNYHGAIDTILFAIFVIFVLYITTFFFEIAIARLADKGKISSALNMIEIRRCLNTIGWVHYTADYTKLIIAIAILAYIRYGIDFIVLDNGMFELIIGILIFLIEFIGIGMIYREYKIKSNMMKRGY